jgi:hypothetical protein
MAKMGCAKCGGTKKMALGGSAVKKAPVQLYGIPQENMGTSSQMGFGRKGGTLNEMARGGTKKSSSAKIVQQFTRKTLSDKALAVRTAGANKARVGKSSAQASVDRLLANKDKYGSKVGAALASSKKAKETQLAANRTAAAKKTLDAVKKVEAAKTVTNKGKKVMNAAQIKAARVTAVKGSEKAAPVAAAKSGDIKLKNKKTISAPASASTKYGPVTRNAAIKTNAGKISTVTKDAAKAAAVKLNMDRQLVKKLKTGENLKVAAALQPSKNAGTARLAEKFKNASNVGNEWKAEAALLKNEAKLLGKGSSAKKLLIGAGVVAAAYGTKKLYDYMKQPAAKPAVKPVVKKDTPKPVVKPVAKPGQKSSTQTLPEVTVTAKRKSGTSSNKKVVPVTKLAETKKTTPAVKKEVAPVSTTVKAADATTTSTTPVTTVVTPAKTPEKVIAKVTPETDKTAVVDRMKNIELSKNPASKKLIESASSNASKTSSAPTTVPRANLINRVRGAINESRERRAVRAETRGDKEKATKLRDKEKATQAKMMKKGGSVKSKKK